jgi:hypothetical protein
MVFINLCIARFLVVASAAAMTPNLGPGGQTYPYDLESAEAPLNSESALLVVVQTGDDESTDQMITIGEAHDESDSDMFLKHVLQIAPESYVMPDNPEERLDLARRAWFDGKRLKEACIGWPNFLQDLCLSLRDFSGYIPGTSIYVHSGPGWGGGDRLGIGHDFEIMGQRFSPVVLMEWKVTTEMLRYLPPKLALHWKHLRVGAMVGLVNDGLRLSVGSLRQMQAEDSVGNGVWILFAKAQLRL